jgi:hypothetical protein
MHRYPTEFKKALKLAVCFLSNCSSIERGYLLLKMAAELPFPIHAHMLHHAAGCAPSGPWSRYKDVAGLHGPSLDREPLSTLRLLTNGYATSGVNERGFK